MKNLIFITGFLCLLFSLASAQINYPIIANDGRTYLIKLKDGKALQGKIVAVEKDYWVSVQQKDGSTLRYYMDEIATLKEAQIPPIGRFGFGLGIPYGILGIQGEAFVADRASVSVGLGTTLFTGLGYSVGAKYYLPYSTPKWKPRVSAYFGTNGMLIDDIYDLSATESYQGFTVGLGQTFVKGPRKNRGLDLDVMVLLTSGLFNTYAWRDSGPLQRFKLSIGYHYSF